MITSLTGEGSVGVQQRTGRLQCPDRVAERGRAVIDGHKINGVVLDDQTSPTQIATAVQDAIPKNPAGIVSTSPLFFLADKYPQQAGLPGHGRFLRRAGVGHARGFTNMFASDVGQRRHQVPGQHGHRRAFRA